MKRLLPFLFIIAITNAEAQPPVIEGTYLPVRGTSVKQVWDTIADSLNVPSQGPDQVWDYSNKFVNITDTFTFASFHPDSTPYAQYFPEATHVSFLRYPFNNPFDSSYIYFKIDYNGMHNLGIFATKAAFDTTFIADPSEFVVPSLINYLDLGYDTSRYVGFGNMSGIDVKLVTTNYKKMITTAYGSLKTPMGSFNDVLLAKEIYHVIDSIYSESSPGSGIYDVSLFTQFDDFTKYSFLRNNTFGSSHLLFLQGDTAETTIDFGWYTLPVDIGSITGTVRDSSLNLVTEGEVYLYREYSNFAKNDILATVYLDINGQYRFDSIPHGMYRIAVRPNLSTYTNALTTYYGNLTNWVEATPVITSADISGIDIELRYHPPETGTGSISGTIDLDLGMNKVGDPVPGLDITIEQIPGTEVKSQDVTNFGGVFSFISLNDGDYRIWVDIPGLYMAGTYEFTVFNGNVINGLDFTVGSDSIFPINTISGINKTEYDTGLPLTYPNPFSSDVIFEYTLGEATNVVLKIYDLLGRQVNMLINKEQSAGTYRILWDGSAENGVELPNAVYFYTFQLEEKDLFTDKLIKY